MIAAAPKFDLPPRGAEQPVRPSRFGQSECHRSLGGPRCTGVERNSVNGDHGQASLMTLSAGWLICAKKWKLAVDAAKFLAQFRLDRLIVCDYADKRINSSTIT
jgi:hypothetical protein